MPSRSARLYWASVGSSLGSVLTATICNEGRGGQQELIVLIFGRTWGSFLTRMTLSWDLALFPYI